MGEVGPEPAVRRSGDDVGARESTKSEVSTRAAGKRCTVTDEIADEACAVSTHERSRCRRARRTPVDRQDTSLEVTRAVLLNSRRVTASLR